MPGAIFEAGRLMEFLEGIPEEIIREKMQLIQQNHMLFGCSESKFRSRPKKNMFFFEHVDSARFGQTGQWVMLVMVREVLKHV